MMGKRKLREIQSAIREVMQNNVIDLALMGRQQNADAFRQSQKLFLYLEMLDTRPAICHVYDMETPVNIGRNETENHICIQDASVSRRHACIWHQSGNLYIVSQSASNLTGVRRGLRTVWLSRGQILQLLSKDKILIGNVKMKIRLFMGENEIA